MKPITLVLLLFVSLKGDAQFFEGMVKYDISYQSHLPSVTNDQMAEWSGTNMQYFIKGGYYRFDFLNGENIQWMIYLDSTQKLYTKLFLNDTIYWKYVNYTPDTILSITVNKSVTEILGRRCDEIIFKVPAGLHKYYYDPSIRIDKSFYINHINGNLSDFLKISNSIPLMEVFESDISTIQSTAIKIEPNQPDADVFKLPAQALFKEGIFY